MANLGTDTTIRKRNMPLKEEKDMVIHDGVYNDEIRDFLKENNLEVSETDFEAI